MAVVELRDIVTDADREAVLAVRMGPGQERFVAGVEESFRDAVTYAHACPRMWAVYAGDEVVGFAMISDGIPEDRLAADHHLVGPYYLWRLLIDEGRQRRGYGTATLDALVAYVRTRPNADVLWVSSVPGDGSPQPFYERYGFRPTDRIVDGEIVLRLDLPREPS
jgi:diamine N-acetyltransferase